MKRRVSYLDGALQKYKNVIENGYQCTREATLKIWIMPMYRYLKLN